MAYFYQSINNLSLYICCTAEVNYQNNYLFMTEEQVGFIPEGRCSPGRVPTKYQCSICMGLNTILFAEPLICNSFPFALQILCYQWWITRASSSHRNICTWLLQEGPHHLLFTRSPNWSSLAINLKKKKKEPLFYILQYSNYRLYSY